MILAVTFRPGALVDEADFTTSVSKGQVIETGFASAAGHVDKACCERVNQNKAKAFDRHFAGSLSFPRLMGASF